MTALLPNEPKKGVLLSAWFNLDSPWIHVLESALQKLQRLLVRSLIKDGVVDGSLKWGVLFSGAYAGKSSCHLAVDGLDPVHKAPERKSFFLTQVASRSQKAGLPGTDTRLCTDRASIAWAQTQDCQRG
eukprot:1161186-Pelagomonas_calceolata.AAC.8